MKIKLFLLMIFGTLALSAAAVDVTDDTDVNSPLVSYLLAKIQQLESKVMAKPAPKQISEVAEVAANQQSAPPPPVVTYTRWGNNSCPFGANTVYRGFAAGGHYSHKGSPANMMCLPPSPRIYSNHARGSYYAYGVEYQTTGPIDHAVHRNMPCAVCEVTGKSTTLMIPSHISCPTGWRHEYNGYIMAGHYNQEGASMYNCVDVTLQQIPGSGANNGGHQLYTIYAVSGQFIPRYSSYALSCVVCSK